jgi:hypothetical protein
MQDIAAQTPPKPPYYIDGPSASSSQQTIMSSLASSLADSWAKLEATTRTTDIVDKKASEAENTVAKIDTDLENCYGWDVEEDFDFRTFFGESEKNNSARIVRQRRSVEPVCLQDTRRFDHGRKPESSVPKKRVVMEGYVQDDAEREQGMYYREENEVST